MVGSLQHVVIISRLLLSSVVTPLLKKPSLNPDDPANFRPISNLNNISKILERLFLNRFQTHVCNCDNFSPVQSAYRRNYSTETALLHTLDSVCTSANYGKPTLLVSLDFSAAFDTIDPPFYSTDLITVLA